MTPRQFATFLLRLPLLGLALGLAGCASAPEFSLDGVDRALTPPRAIETDARDRRVFWGGTLIAAHNLQDVTHLEMVAYPLDGDGWPQLDAEPLGRFIIEQRGFLDPAKYASGRQLTVVGRLITPLHGRIGERDYTYPVVLPEQLHLWPVDWEQRSRPQVRFSIGIGIGIHR
ncbi:MAG TPA: hypothetical protein ENJ01_00880 [Gammaproteobacteria bacterium]|nr:hypothetical protein [Gammaproteobacteria bacterium]